MCILTPTTRGAEQEVKSLTIHAALHRPITLSCEINIEAMRYTTTCHRLGRRPEPTEARQASPRDHCWSAERDTRSRAAVDGAMVTPPAFPCQQPQGQLGSVHAGSQSHDLLTDCLPVPGEASSEPDLP
jgi:hypothetical protein